MFGILAVIPTLADNSKLPVIWWIILLAEPVPNVNAFSEDDICTLLIVNPAPIATEPLTLMSPITSKSFTTWNGFDEKPPLIANVAKLADST